MAKLIRTTHTNQPYIQFSVYDIDGVEVVVRHGGMRQTWDAQPFHAPTRINDRRQDTAANREALRLAGVEIEDE